MYASLPSLAACQIAGCQLAAVSVTNPSTKYSFELGFMHVYVNKT